MGAQNRLASAHRSGDPPVRQNHPRWACRNSTFPLYLPRAPGLGRTPRRPPADRARRPGWRPRRYPPWRPLSAPQRARRRLPALPPRPRPASAIRAALTPLGAMPGAEPPAGGGTRQGAHRPPGRAAFAGCPGGVERPPPTGKVESWFPLYGPGTRADPAVMAVARLISVFGPVVRTPRAVDTPGTPAYASRYSPEENSSSTPPASASWPVVSATSAPGTGPHHPRVSPAAGTGA